MSYNIIDAGYERYEDDDDIECLASVSEAVCYGNWVTFDLFNNVYMDQHKSIASKERVKWDTYLDTFKGNIEQVIELFEESLHRDMYEILRTGLITVSDKDSTARTHALVAPFRSFLERPCLYRLWQEMETKDMYSYFLSHVIHYREYDSTYGHRCGGDQTPFTGLALIDSDIRMAKKVVSLYPSLYDAFEEERDMAYSHIVPNLKKEILIALRDAPSPWKVPNSYPSTSEVYPLAKKTLDSILTIVKASIAK